MPSKYLTFEQKAEDWRYFYRSYFGLDLSLADIYVPRMQPEYEQLIIVAEGMTVGKFLRQYDIHAGENLDVLKPDMDALVPFNDRTAANGSYAIWVRDSAKNGPWNGRDANSLSTLGVRGQTLLERLLHGIKRWQEGRPIDKYHLTLCIGSRYVDGWVPTVGWAHNALHIGRGNPDYGCNHLRCREVIE